MPRRGETEAERRSRLGREGAATLMCMLGEDGRHAWAARARAGIRRRCAELHAALV